MKAIVNSVILLSMYLLVIGAMSCKKDETEEPPEVKNYTVPGLWEGSYQTTQVAHAPAFAGFTFYTDSTMVLKANPSGYC